MDLETRLVLIRHGETDDNVAKRIAGWRESALTERGRIQAERVAEFVATRYRPAAIYTSPLRRATETAEGLARRLGHPLRHDHGLRELHFGDAEGLTLDEMGKRFPEILARARNDEDDDFGWPNGETRRAFYVRTRQSIDVIANAHPGETVAVVTHGGVVSRLLADIVEGKPGRWATYLTTNCSISEIVVSAGTHSLVCWNVTEHLGELA
jgi:2,3-bisphosphoglycerate-dependent phosphoglycerate mutase